MSIIIFCCFYSSSKNDSTKCPKKGCETKKIDPLTAKYELITPKQQKSQKSVWRVFKKKKKDGYVHFLVFSSLFPHDDVTRTFEKIQIWRIISNWKKFWLFAKCFKSSRLLRRSSTVMFLILCISQIWIIMTSWNVQKESTLTYFTSNW